LCLLALPRAAAAEWHFTPMVGLTFAGNTSIIDPDLATDNVHPNVGGAVTLLGGGIVGVEGLFVLTPGFFQAGREAGLVRTVESSRTFVVMGNVVVTVPRRWTEYFLRPFVSGGAGLLHASYDTLGDVLPPLRENIAAFDIGGGAIGFFSADTGIRFDVRYYSNLRGFRGQDVTLTTDRGHLRYMTLSVGLVLRR
jgi:hypothetical protein